MKKLLKVSLFIVVFLLILGLQKSFAVEEDFYTKEEYCQKYGNKILIAASVDGEDMSFLNGVSVEARIGKQMQLKFLLVDIDDLYNYYASYYDSNEEINLSGVMIDYDDLTIINEEHPNIVSNENGNITALAEGYYSFTGTYEKDGIIYKVANSVNGNGIDLTYSFRMNITKRESFLDDFDTLVQIDNSVMKLTKENDSDEARVSCLWIPCGEFPYDAYSYEWSVDDDSIVEIKVTEGERNELNSNKWNDVKVTAKKNGTTKVRCKVSTVLENGETQVIEKVIDVTVTGFDEESAEPSNDEEEKTNTQENDDTVANKPLSKTGEQGLLFIALIGAAVFVIYRFKKYKSLSNKEIK